MSGTISLAKQITDQLSITHKNMAFKCTFKKMNGDLIISNYGTIIDKYLPLIKQHTINYEVLPEEEKLYFYQPKRLSQDLYGTTELWSTIMNINHVYNISQFNKSNILILNQDGVDLIEEIIIREGSKMDDQDERIL